MSRFEQNGLVTRLVTTSTIDSPIYMGFKGRMYDRWIDHILALDASKNRTMGDIEDGLIDCPP